MLFDFRIKAQQGTMEQVHGAEFISAPTKAYTRWYNSVSSRIIWEASALRSHPPRLTQLHQTLRRLTRWCDSLGLI